MEQQTAGTYNLTWHDNASNDWVTESNPRLDRRNLSVTNQPGPNNNRYHYSLIAGTQYYFGCKGLMQRAFSLL